MIRRFIKRRSDILDVTMGDLELRVDELTAQVAELQAQMSVVDGRSSLNAERNVRTHSSLQNLAEDFEALTKQVQQSDPEEE